MGYRFTRYGEDKTVPYFLVEHDHLSARWTTLPQQATLFKYDDAQNILGAMPWSTAEFVPQTEGEREFDRGTLWITPKGDAYRLRDYGPDFDSDEPFEHEVPRYDVSYVGGGHTTLDHLPANATLIWHPKGK